MVGRFTNQKLKIENLKIWNTKSDADDEEEYLIPLVENLPLSYSKRPKETTSSDEDEPPSKQSSPRKSRSRRKPSRYRSQEFATYEELIAIRKALKLTKNLDRNLNNSNKNRKNVNEKSKNVDEISSSFNENLLNLDENLESLDKDPNIVETKPKKMTKNSKNLNKNSRSLYKNTKDVNKNSKDVNKNSKGLNKNSKGLNKKSKGLNKNSNDLNKNSNDLNKISKGLNKNTKRFDKSTKMSIKSGKSLHKNSKKSKNSTKMPKQRQKNSEDLDESSNDDAESFHFDSSESDDDRGRSFRVNRRVDDFVGSPVNKDGGPNEPISLESEESSEEEAGNTGLPRKPRISEFSLYCNECKVAWEGDCPKHGPLIAVKDLKVISQNVHSMMTAPPQVYIGTCGGYRVADNPKNGKGVFARTKLASRIRFGPLQGKIVPPETPQSWLVRKNGKPFRGIDVSSPDTSNWMRFVKVSRNESVVNCDAYQYQGLIFFKTIREISPQEELVVGAYDYNGFLLKQDAEDDTTRTESAWGSHFGENVSMEDIISMEGTEDIDINSILCPMCYETFPTHSELDEHILSHIKEKPFGCTKCNKRFADQSMLIIHENNHTLKQKKPYSTLSTVCPECNKVFATKTSLKRHTNTIHGGEKLFECQECNATFATKSNLDSHSRTHSDERPFECIVCSKTFKAKSALKRHMAFHAY